MIPSMTNSAAVPITMGKLLFHVIVDDFNSTFSMDGPGGLNGFRIHHEIMQVLRSQKRKLREFDLRAESQDAALTNMMEFFPDYVFLGSWADAQVREYAGLPQIDERRAHRRLDESYDARRRAMPV